jgi:hypothetical protein
MCEEAIRDPSVLQFASSVANGGKRGEDVRRQCWNMLTPTWVGVNEGTAVRKDGIVEEVTN